MRFRGAVFKAVLRNDKFVPAVSQLCEKEGQLNEILWVIVAVNKKYDLSSVGNWQSPT